MIKRWSKYYKTETIFYFSVKETNNKTTIINTNNYRLTYFFVCLSM